MKKQITAPIPNGRLKINISTDGCGGRPYFSITADEYEFNRIGYGRMVACGCLHDEILKVRPDLKFLVDIHLSDIDGAPMHAEANGWYWLAKAAGIAQEYGPDQSRIKCAEIFADHVRMPVDYVEDLIERIQEIYLSSIEHGDTHFLAVAFTKQAWSVEVNNLRPIWKKQAAAALKKIKKLA